MFPRPRWPLLSWVRARSSTGGEGYLQRKAWRRLVFHRDFRERDGLATIDGSDLITGMGCLELCDAERWIRTQEVALAITLEALNANMKAYDHRIHLIRGYPGAQECAENVRRLTEGSELLNRPGRKCRMLLPALQPAGHWRGPRCLQIDPAHAGNGTEPRRR